MCPTLCIVDSSAGSDLIRVDVWDPIRLDSLRHRDMPDIHSVSDINLKVS